VISGGHFASGFLADGFSALAAPYVGDVAGSSEIAGTAVSAVLGGAASILGGGKFANGAISGAFAYLRTSHSDSSNGSEEDDVKFQGGLTDGSDMQSMLSGGDPALIPAIEATADYFGIDRTGITFNASTKLVDDALTDPGTKTVWLGPSAFRSAGFLGSTISHEVEIHIHDQLNKGVWYNAGKNPQGYILQEMQAYDYQLSPAQVARFGLKPDETKALVADRLKLFNKLTTHNQIKANAGNYTP